ncbi:flagellar basal-body MS-ring/collar protein FliF [Piscinibacter gummiphilus]|uniref:Flagellar M-ring protein n=1 Tax=Piscinibacter gummiphilus TaxID=946333 RepID=A0ABZ0CZ80_9BURK|nr:flagellar basal-body MS-ring/collar protein FliF [Piscinibacter gummiphilus]WOB09816.1 flagellar basal-body MS-ring/collar protein FliF [Piscinibacter gummiphilus]
MDNAVAIANPNVLPANAGFGARLAALPTKSRIGLGLGVAALIAVLAALTLWSSQGDYKVLYANLSDKDGGAIIAQLSQLNVPYRYTEGGGAILVPASQVHDLRLKLASAGLPKGSVVGFELMDGAKFGQTQFQERLTFQRGLEGELTRSITAMPSVQNARVHLALPNQNGFFREQQKPSASVMLTLYPGRTLDRSQVAGIVHLVSSSVPEMNPKAVSVLDQTGALLSGPQEGNNGAGLDAQQLQYVNQIEASYTKRILDILEPVVGRDNLRAQVTAELDFSQTEATSEEFKPNQGPNAQATVRSMQSSEQSGSQAGGATGIPGATSNQPPVAATAPVTGASSPLQAAQAGGQSNSSRSAVTNYEVDKTVKVTRNATGTVKRLNAAVVVNHITKTDAKGKTTTTPLTAGELENLNSLVRESIGFKQDRGDSVKIINAPFKVEAAPKDETPIWKQPATVDLLRAAVVPAALALVALVVIFTLIRPALKAALQPPAPEPREALAVVDDKESLPEEPEMLRIESPKVSAHLASARTFAKENPSAVANIVRGWVNGDTLKA